MRTPLLALAGLLAVSVVGGWFLSRQASEERAVPAKVRPLAVASHEVVMYSSPGCHACELAAKWFARHDVPYTELDIRSDAARDELRGRVVRWATPTIDVDGQLVIGFDPGRLMELLEL